MINITTQNRTKNKNNLNFQQPIQLNQKKLESELNLCETEFNGKDVFSYNAVDKNVPIFSKSVNNFHNFHEYDKEKEFVNTSKQHEISIINKLKQLTTSSNNNKNIDNSDSDNLEILTYFSKCTKNNTNYNLNQKKINLVFSIDQFLFEISKKQPQRRKYSEYHKQLKEKKKLSIFYGYLSKKQLKNLISECQSYQSHFCENLFSLLERRLDIFLYRSGLAKNIITARQLIAHKKIMVNKNIVNIASYQIKPGDIISMSLTKKKQLMKVEGVYTLSNDNNKREPEQYIANPSSHVSGGLRRNVNENKNTFKYKDKNISRLKPLFLMLTNLNLFQLNEKTANSKKKTTLKNMVGFLLKKISKYNNNNPQQKKKYYTTSSLSKKTLSLYRNVVYKVLLDMNSYFFYSNCFNSNYESTPKNRTNNLLILKLRKHTHAINRGSNISRSIERSKFYGNYDGNYGNRENSRINTISYTSNNVLKPLGYSFVVPLHIEISYSIKTAIFLYSPQRLNFPFYIDVDLILRSLN